MASNVIDLFGAVTSRARSVAASLDTPGRKLYAQAPDGYTDTGVARGNEPASAPKTSAPTSTDPLGKGEGGFTFQDFMNMMNNAAKGSNPLGAVDQSGNNGQAAERNDALPTGFISRALWGGAGFALFLVGAIMSRPREVQALAAATDTAGNILSAPAKATKGALDTVGLFKVSAPRKAIASDKKPPALEARPSPDDGGSGGDQSRMRAALRRGADDPKPGTFELGGKGDTLEFGEVNATKAAGRSENARNAANARWEKARKKAQEILSQDLAQPSPAEALKQFAENARKSRSNSDVPLGDAPDERRTLRPGDKPPNQRKET